VSCKESRQSLSQAIGCIPIQSLDQIAAGQPFTAENAETVPMSLLRTKENDFPEDFCVCGKGLVFVLGVRGEITPYKRNKVTVSEFLSNFQAKLKTNPRFMSWDQSNGEMFDKLDPLVVQTGIDCYNLPIFTCMASHKDEILVSCELKRKNSEFSFPDIVFCHLKFNRNGKLRQLGTLDMNRPGSVNFEKPTSQLHVTFRINPHAYRGATLWYCISITSKISILCTRGNKLHLLASPKQFTTTWINSSLISENNKSLLICCQNRLHKCILPK